MAAGVEFDEDTIGMSRPGLAARPGMPQYGGSSGQTSGLTGWLIKKGIAKSEKSAQIIQVVVVIVDIIIMYVLIKFFL